MKWIGQHIWSFISRFRSKVYLEDVTNAGSDTDAFLVKKADGEIAIRTGAEVLSDIGASAEASDLEISNASDNRVVTSSGGTDLNAEANLTFDGTTLNVTGKADISPSNSVGGPALTIDNDDIDQSALFIDADNTVKSVIDIEAHAQTSDAVIDIDQNLNNTGAIATRGIRLDIDKVAGSSGADQHMTGLDININDQATNAVGATNSITGITNTLMNANNQGNITQYGIKNSCIGGDTADTIGLWQKIEDGGLDLYFLSSDATTVDYFSLATGASGATTLTTVDGGGLGADLALNIDGKITMTPANINGVVFHLDANASVNNVVDIDAGGLDIDVDDIVRMDAAGTITLTSTATGGDAVHINAATHGSSVVNIDAGTLDIDTSGAITIDSTSTTAITAGTSMTFHSARSQINQIFDFASETFENQLTGGAATGTIIKYGGGGGLNTAEIYYLRSTGSWVQAQADDEATTAPMLGVPVGADPASNGMLIKGFVVIPNTEILNTPGSGGVDGLPVYLSDSNAGHFDFNAPSASGRFVRIVGYAIDDNLGDVLIYFDPDKTYIEIA